MAQQWPPIPRNHSQCRFCSMDISSTQTAGINLLQASDLLTIVKDVYGVKILPTDQCSTTVCVPCFQKLMKHYNHRLHYMQLKKTFKLNQLVLLSQVNASICAPDTSDVLDASSTITKGSSVVSPPNTTTNKDDAQEVAPEANVGPIATNMRMKHLVPVLVDCIKEPNYLAALWPILVTLNTETVKPLMYLCNVCKKKFDTKEAYESHQTRSCCVPCCRYCQSIWTEEHRCAFQTRFAAVMPYIAGNDRYCTQQVGEVEQQEEVITVDSSSHEVLEDDVNQTKNNPPGNQTSQGNQTKAKATKRARDSRSRSTSERRVTAAVKRPNESAKRTKTEQMLTLPAEFLALPDPYPIDISSEEELTLMKLMDRKSKTTTDQNVKKKKKKKSR
uniref:ZAD domain-containing protein n=1 Tax=Anopheles farauti TaxID=69004 RepID=A0A182QE68_9DIPT